MKTESRLRRRIISGLLYLLILVFALNYTLSAVSIAAGDFDLIGLPAVMITMEFWANLLEGLGWFMVLIAALRGARAGSASIAAFLAGMFFFDVLTTWPLEMPLPPGFLYWGSAVVLLQLAVARGMLVNSPHRRAPAAPAWCVAGLLLGAAAFAVYAVVLSPAALAAAGLPPEVAVLHRLAHVIMAAAAVVVALLAWQGRAIAAWALYPLGGMWCWQVLTTALLVPWPGPPAQVVWGPFSVALLLAIAMRLHPTSFEGAHE